MTDADVVFDQTLTGIDHAQSDANSFADFVTKEPAIEAAFEERRPDCEESQYD
jgi:hypothetical protein